MVKPRAQPVQRRRDRKSRSVSCLGGWDRRIAESIPRSPRTSRQASHQGPDRTWRWLFCRETGLSVRPLPRLVPGNGRTVASVARKRRSAAAPWTTIQMNAPNADHGRIHAAGKVKSSRRDRQRGEDRAVERAPHDHGHQERIIRTMAWPEGKAARSSRSRTRHKPRCSERPLAPVG